MKRIIALITICLLMAGACSKQKSRILYPSTPPAYVEEILELSRSANWTFDSATTGRLPDGWRSAETNSAGTPAAWAVVADPSAPSQPNVLAITETKNKGSTYNLALAINTSFQDVDLAVKVKANSGTEDQGGGPVWRARDGDNYYVCRLNPSESNYRVYKVVGGKRQREFASATVEAKSGEWHTLRAVMKGSHIDCYLDGKKMLEADDESLPDPGMIGLWSKADAATAFDDLAAKAAE